MIGLVAGAHCLPGHDERLRALGVKEIAYSFDDVRQMLLACCLGQMPALGALGGEIIGVVRIGRHVVSDALDHLNAGGGEPVDLGRIVGQQPRLLDAQRAQHRRRMDIIALVVGEASR